MKNYVYLLCIAFCFVACKKKQQKIQPPKVETVLFQFPKNEKKYVQTIEQQLEQNVTDKKALTAWQTAIKTGKYTPVLNSYAKTNQVKAILQQVQDNGLGFIANNELTQIDSLLQKMRDGSLTQEELIQAEIQYRTVLNNYSNALQFGVLEPKKVFPKEYYVKNLKADSTWFANDFQKENYLGYLQNLKVNNPLYPLLVEKYKNLTTQQQWEEIKAPEKPVKAGNNYSEVPKLRKRFGLPEVADTAANYLLYDEKLAAHIADFQAWHALSNDAVIGKGTVKMLNQTPEQLKLKVEAVLERLRWNNGENYENAYIANIPEFKMYVMENGQLAKTFDVGVGLANKHHTPEFIDTLEYVVVNPTWTVPYSIATKEMLPKIKRNPGYLTRNNYRLLRGRYEVSPYAVNWGLYSRRNFPFTIVQKPGDRNALGRIKFLFPNKHAIYFHDTPSKYIFKNTSRAVSHGCIRVKDPFKLGDFVMDNDPEYIKSKSTDVLTNFKAKKGYPVVITYVTTVIDENGKLRNVEDVYGKDAILQQAWKEFKEQYE